MWFTRSSKKRRKHGVWRSGRRPRVEYLEPRMMLSAVPYGAHQQDTGEYMLGDIVATVVLFESNGALDSNTEDWNQLVRDNNGAVVLDEFGRTISVSGTNLIEEVKDNVKEGLTWWQDTLANFGSWQDTPSPTPVHSLNFIYDFQYAHNPIDTGYEPISRRSNDYVYWAEDFLQEVGYDTFNSLDVDIRAFNDSQRTKYDADWAFTIFVVNDHNDMDGRFAAGGSFQRAFAFAGGRFLVSPAQRPASTFAHESGHMFWARDEYAGGGSYTLRRGYYDTPNLNAEDDQPPGFVQQDSLMASGTLLDNAWARHVSSESSLAMIGWQDSDADGVFDVLDVPLTLTGGGYYDPDAEVYRFVGHSAVQTLANQNTSGLQNDITINEVSVAEYSTDGGTTWQIAHEYHAYEANLDLTIPLQSGQDVLIRTRDIDAGTGMTVATSDTVFHGSTALPTSADVSGIQGYAWHDQDGDAAWDVGEPGLSGWTMQLVDDQGQPLALTQVLEPDDYTEGQHVNDVLTGVSLSAVGYGTADNRVGAVSASTASTGQRVLSYIRAGTLLSWGTEWNADSRRLRIDFDSPVAMLSLDAVAPNRDAYGRLEVYDSNDQLLARYTTQLLTNNHAETMTLIRSTPDIAYAIAGSTKDTSVVLDNLHIGPDSTATTDAMGAYAMQGLPAGQYHVQAIAPAHWLVTAPVAGVQDTVVLSDGTMQDRTGDFAGQRDANAFPWQNPRDPLDVDDRGSVIPLDALIIINELNMHGSHELPAPSAGQEPPPYLDVSGDNHLSPLDALLIINFLNNRPTGGPSGEAPAGLGGSGAGAEGEAWQVDTTDDPSPIATPRVAWELQVTTQSVLQPTPSILETSDPDTDHAVAGDAPAWAKMTVAAAPWQFDIPTELVDRTAPDRLATAPNHFAIDRRATRSQEQPAEETLHISGRPGESRQVVTPDRPIDQCNDRQRDRTLEHSDMFGARNRWLLEETLDIIVNERASLKEMGKSAILTRVTTERHSQVLQPGGTQNHDVATSATEACADNRRPTDG